MGYIGLLLNAPYKIDSMVWMRLMMICMIIYYSVFVFVVLWGLSEPEGKMG
jgi:hypothetical protein